MIDFQTIDRPILFADFEADTEIGTQTFTISEEMFALWTKLYPADAACSPFMPPGMMAMVVMRGYMGAIPNRPPGNIHAEQRIELLQLPNIGDTVKTAFRCSRREQRVGRKWVYLTSDTTDETGNILFVGRMTSIWSQ